MTFKLRIVPMHHLRAGAEILSLLLKSVLEDEPHSHYHSSLCFKSTPFLLSLTNFGLGPCRVRWTGWSLSVSSPPTCIHHRAADPSRKDVLGGASPCLQQSTYVVAQLCFSKYV